MILEMAVCSAVPNKKELEILVGKYTLYSSYTATKPSIAQRCTIRKDVQIA